MKSIEEILNNTTATQTELIYEAYKAGVVKGRVDEVKSAIDYKFQCSNCGEENVKFTKFDDLHRERLSEHFYYKCPDCGESEFVIWKER